MMPWGSFFHPRDSIGRESRTLAFVGIAFIVLTIRFFAGGFELTLGPVHWLVQSAPLTDYGVSVAAILAVWVGRTWVENTSRIPPTNQS